MDEIFKWYFTSYELPGLMEVRYSKDRELMVRKSDLKVVMWVFKGGALYCPTHSCKGEFTYADGMLICEKCGEVSDLD